MKNHSILSMYMYIKYLLVYPNHKQIERDQIEVNYLYINFINWNKFHLKWLQKTKGYMEHSCKSLNNIFKKNWTPIDLIEVNFPRLSDFPNSIEIHTHSYCYFQKKIMELYFKFLKLKKLGYIAMFIRSVYKTRFAWGAKLASPPAQIQPKYNNYREIQYCHHFFYVNHAKMWFRITPKCNQHMSRVSCFLGTSRWSSSSSWEKHVILWPFWIVLKK